MSIKLDPDQRKKKETEWFDIHKRRMLSNFTGKDGLLEFVRYFWHVLEPNTVFVDGWPLHAICDHLQAVSDGKITRLLINVPPGFMKSLLVDVFWPAWEWAIYGAHLRYVTFSYSSDLTRRDNRRFGALVQCLEYQRLFSDKVVLVKTGEELVSNTATGWKLASSIGGVGTGERGDRVILDDPHNVKESESVGVRQETVRWFREAMSNRLNDMETSAIVIIMQRVHGEDVAGVILETGMAYEHLMIPMYYEYERQTDNNYDPVMTSIGWYDPRFEDCDPNNPEERLLAWEERFPQQVCDNIQIDINIWAWASQYQQSPAPRGGGIFKREWWQVYDHPEKKWPEMQYVLASLDSAFTEKEQNDPSALTVWGLFKNREEKTRVMLIRGWRKHLQFSAPAKNMVPLPGEGKFAWVQRTQQYWGLIEWVKYTCEQCKVDNLLIEAKANGISAAQYMQNHYGRMSFGIQLCPVKGSKLARAYAVQPTFAQQMVYAPVWDWSEVVIEEMEYFPKHRYDDMTDSATQAIKFIRDNGLLVDDAEHEALEIERLTLHGKKKELTFW